LVRRYALLGTGHKPKAKCPFGQRDVTAFHRRASHHRELSAAIIAVDQARAVFLAFVVATQTFPDSPGAVAGLVPL
jgi:hypothetical protein